MGKLRTLQSVKRSEIMDNFDIEEIRLYLLLLANSGENGDGEILLKVINGNGAFGKGFSRDRLNAACRKFAEYGLIEVLPLSPEKIKSNNPKLVYKIFPVKQRQGNRFFSDSSSLL